MPLTRLIPSPSISQAETKGLGTLSSSVGNLHDHRLKGCPLLTSGFTTRQQHRSTHMRLYGKTARGRLHQIYNDKQLSDAPGLTRGEHPNLFQASRQSIGAARKMVGQGRLELPTSRLSSARSNQLSY
jgi:hypothetical protein